MAAARGDPMNARRWVAGLTEITGNLSHHQLDPEDEG